MVRTIDVESSYRIWPVHAAISAATPSILANTANEAESLPDPLMICGIANKYCPLFLASSSFFPDLRHDVTLVICDSVGLCKWTVHFRDTCNLSDIVI